MKIWIWSLWFGCAEPTEIEEHGHEHGEEESVQQTIWSEKLEVFIEYPALREGSDSKMLAHITWLDKHRPLDSGSLTVHLKNDAEHEQFTADTPARTGIFIPILSPKKEGEYHLSLSVQSEGYQEEIDLGQVEVSSHHGHDHGHHHDHGEEAEIALLKEQAWKMDFQTAPVQRKEMLSSIEALGTWFYSPSDKEKIVATTSGIIGLGDKLLLEGQKFQQGERIAFIQSGELTGGSLLVQWQQKKAQWMKVQAEYERKKPLLEKGIISKAQWEELEQRYLVIKAEYDMLSKNTRGGVKQVSAPVDGELFEVFVENGDFVEQGDEIVSLVRSAPSIVQVEISQRYLAEIPELKQLAYQTSQGWKIANVKAFTARKVNDTSQMVLIKMEVPSETELIEGALTEARLVFGVSKSTVVVPSSALLEEYGRFSVVEQISGEGFTLREVQLGRKNTEYVEIISGVEEGDWVVSKGAYFVKMMSLSGQVPEHGHAH